jgi:hypothetical protein
MMDKVLLVPFKKRSKSNYPHNHAHNMISSFRYEEGPVSAIMENDEYPD